MLAVVVPFVIVNVRFSSTCALVSSGPFSSTVRLLICIFGFFLSSALILGKKFSGHLWLILSSKLRQYLSTALLNIVFNWLLISLISFFVFSIA